jgi:hypothetical protein
VLRGDVIDISPTIAAALPRSLPRLVVHTATPIDVPRERRLAFDTAFAAFGAHGPMLHLALEDDQRTAPRDATASH